MKKFIYLSFFTPFWEFTLAKITSETGKKSERIHSFFPSFIPFREFTLVRKFKKSFFLWQRFKNLHSRKWQKRRTERRKRKINFFFSFFTPFEFTRIHAHENGERERLEGKIKEFVHLFFFRTIL